MQIGRIQEGESFDAFVDRCSKHAAPVGYLAAVFDEVGKCLAEHRKRVDNHPARLDVLDALVTRLVEALDKAGHWGKPSGATTTNRRPAPPAIWLTPSSRGYGCTWRRAPIRSGAVCGTSRTRWV